MASSLSPNTIPIASILPHSPPFALPVGTSSKSPTHAAWQQIQYLKDILLSPKRQIRNIYQTRQTPREANKKKKKTTKMKEKKSESRSKGKSWSKSESDRGKRSKTIYNNSFSFTWTWTWTWSTPTVQQRSPPQCVNLLDMLNYWILYRRFWLQ